MKNLFIIFCLLITISANIPVWGQVKDQKNCDVCKCEKICDCEVELFERFIKRAQHSRSTVYNALDLTDEQIKIYEELLAKNKPIYETKFEDLYKEFSRLKILKLNKISEVEICKQKYLIANIKKEIILIFENENREFKKCLTREQRAKYSMIKKLEHDDFKKICKHQKDYYKSNPKMRPFGNPPIENCECEEYSAKNN